MKVYVGIDPGKDGAICKMYNNAFNNRKLWHLSVMPTILVGSKKKKRVYDIPAIVSILRGADEYVIEKVHAMPGQGVVSMFSFGMGYGLVLGIVAATGKPYTLVAPQTWKKVMLRDMSKGKNSAVERAKQLFPEVNLLPTERCRKAHEGMAEALLITEYAIAQLVRAEEEK